MADGTELTHVRADGAVHMVDVSGKQVTKRLATAEARLVTTDAVVAMITDGTLPKGEALATSRIAGIMAAKKTSELIPLCHPLPISAVTVDFVAEGSAVRVTASVTTTGVTGVEMEALTAATVAVLTLYDMIKAVDRAATIEGVRVLEKSGGRSGEWKRGE
jgi:cyclic pyranopterin phosphate synthase